jgi:hypothetical protein
VSTTRNQAPLFEDIHVPTTRNQAPYYGVYFGYVILPLVGHHSLVGVYFGYVILPCVGHHIFTCFTSDIATVEFHDIVVTHYW